jgi:hypothetical protein
MEGLKEVAFVADVECRCAVCLLAWLDYTMNGDVFFWRVRFIGLHEAGAVDALCARCEWTRYRHDRHLRCEVEPARCEPILHAHHEACPLTSGRRGHRAFPHPSGHRDRVALRILHDVWRRLAVAAVVARLAPAAVVQPEVAEAIGCRRRPEETPLVLLSFPYVCPKPVLVK